jgi:hypothetical protein
MDAKQFVSPRTDPLLARAEEDWRKVATGEHRALDAFETDLRELHQRDDNY